jgi:hypothetical protein
MALSACNQYEARTKIIEHLGIIYQQKKPGKQREHGNNILNICHEILLLSY